MSPIIRAARDDEAPELSELALRSKASWGYPPEWVELFRTELTLTAVDLERVFVVEVDGVPAGFYSLRWLSEVRAELGHLFVEPALHRRGLGKLMMEDAVRRARAGGFRVLEIQGDPNAIDFYERVGGVRVGVLESESIAGRMLPLLEISLTVSRGSRE